jgi:hypothetical protein
MIRCLLSTISLLVSLAPLQAQEPASRSVAAAMTEAAQKFVETLDLRSRSVALMRFEDPARLDWHNVPKPHRKGMQLRDMNQEQRVLCHHLLRSALSETGYIKATNIMALENNLREGEKQLTGSPLRDPERFFLTIFGKPGRDGTWGWSFEGHHLSLNFVIRDGDVISDTPGFWGSNPATVKVFVHGGPSVGTRNLADEEQLAFDLLHALDGNQRRIAIIAEKAPADYRFAGLPQPQATPPAGLSASGMNDQQKRILLSVIEAYCNHLSSGLALRNLTQIKAEGIDQIHFAWAGSIQPGVGHYYCVQSPSFMLELVNVQSDPQGNPANHIHSAWRNLKGDFGQPIKP